MKAALARHGRIALWLAWALPFAIYAWSAYRTVGFWDIGEMDTVPWILGIAHPTGFPAYVLSGWLFTHLVPIGSIAYRMGLLSGVAMSLAAWLIARTVSEEYDAPWVGASCAWLFAFGDIAWTRGSRAEVHALATAAVAATLYLALRWYKSGSKRAFVAGAATWAIGIATHPVALLIAPGLLVLLIARIRRLDVRTFAAAVGVCIAIVAGLYAYLPLRSAYVDAHHLDPAITLGVAPGANPFWNYNDPSTKTGFFTEVTGADFDVSDGVTAIANIETYVGEMPRYLRLLVTEFTPVGITLSLFGLAAAFIRDPVRAVALLAASVASIAFALGFSAEGDPNRYFLSSYVIAAIFSGDGVLLFVSKERHGRWLPPLVVGVLAGWLIYSGRATLGQLNDNRATEMVDRVLQLTPPDAVIVSAWSDATPLAYAAYVEHRTDQRTLVVAWADGHQDEIRRWVKQRPVYFVGPMFGEIHGYHFEDVSNTPAVYRLVANRPRASKGTP